MFSPLIVFALVIDEALKDSIIGILTVTFDSIFIKEL
jgi:hypothetical protein